MSRLSGWQRRSLKFGAAPPKSKPMMDMRQWIILGSGSALAAVLTWVACHWWYGRRIGGLAAKLAKVEKARLFTVQQALQARKQIEALQKDLAAQNEALEKAQVARQRSRHLEEVLKAASEAESTETLLARPANGFADTQPLV
jgi:hypothetical protein